MAFSAVVVVLALLAAITATNAATWTYAPGTHGPLHWKTDAPDCGKARQSPINLNLLKVPYNASLAPFSMVNYDAAITGLAVEMQNNGHTLRVGFNYPAGGLTAKTSRSGIAGTYEAAQFHFHWGSDNERGSEHTVNGDGLPIELHFVHKNMKYANLTQALSFGDGLLVFGTFATVGDQNSEIFNILDPLISTVPLSSNVTAVPPFSLMKVFPDDRHHYIHYQGSLTTPPCSEVVEWHVFKKHLTITEATLDKFRALKGDDGTTDVVNNYRAVQPINGRHVSASYDTTTTKSGGARVVLYSFATVLFASMMVAMFSLVQ